MSNTSLTSTTGAGATRAAVYVRVSSAEQVEGTSLETQRDRCRAYIAAHGWTMAGEYADEGVSGALGSRPALDRLLAAVEVGEVNAIVVAKLDRLGRSMRHLTGLLADLDERRVQLVSVAEGFESTSASGRLQRNVLGSFAEFERETIRERTWSGRVAAVRQGYWPGGPPPYGFAVRHDVDKHPRLVLDDAEAEVIRTVIGWHIDEQLTTGEAAARLNALGVSTRNGGPWTHRRLRWIIQYGSPLGGRWAFAPVSGTRRRPDEALVVLEVPELVTEERRDALVRLFASTALGPRPYVRDYVLTGRFASPCQAHYRGQNVQDKTRGLPPAPKYRCYGKRSGCSCPNIGAQAAEDAVWAEVVALLADPRRLELLATQWAAGQRNHRDASTDTLTTTTRRIAKLERSLADRVGEYLRAGLPAQAVRNAAAEIESELAALRAHRDRLVAHQAASSGATRQLDQLAELAATRLSDANADLRRKVLALLDVQVTVTGASTCSTCAGRRKVRGGRGGARCPSCEGTGIAVHLELNGSVPEAILTAGSLVASSDDQTTWPWSGETAVGA